MLPIAARDRACNFLNGVQRDRLMEGAGDCQSRALVSNAALRKIDLYLIICEVLRDRCYRTKGLKAIKLESTHSRKSVRVLRFYHIILGSIQIYDKLINLWQMKIRFHMLIRYLPCFRFTPYKQ